MQVLKFGGSSVANAENINKVVEIIKNKKADAKTIVVVSALGGITDLLLKTAALAEANDESYKIILKEIQDRLFTVGSSLACDPDKEPLMKIPDLKETDIELLE